MTIDRRRRALLGRRYVHARERLEAAQLAWDEDSCDRTRRELEVARHEFRLVSAAVRREH